MVKLSRLALGNEVSGRADWRGLWAGKINGGRRGFLPVALRSRLKTDSQRRTLFLFNFRTQLCNSVTIQPF